MGSTPSSQGNRLPMKSSAGVPDDDSHHLLTNNVLASEPENNTCNIKKHFLNEIKEETVDESLRSQHSQIFDIKDSESSSDQEDEHISGEELATLQASCFQKLEGIATKFNQTDMESASEDSLQSDTANDLMFINDLYGYLLSRVTRKELESFRKGVAEKLIELKIFDFMTSVVKAFPVGIDLPDATSRQHVIFRLVNIVLQSIFNYTDASEALGIAVANSVVIEFCKLVLERRAEQHLKKERHGIMEDFLLSVHGIIHNVSVRDVNVECLQQMGFTKVLQPYLKSHDDDISMATLTTLANIVTEDECDVIAANVLLVARLLFMLERGLETENHRFAGWSCRECGLAVRNLAKNDGNKKLLWNLNALKVLVELAKTGDTEEQTESVHAIWALAFDEEVSKDIANNEDLGVVDLLLDLKKSSTSDSLKNAVNKCLWTLKDVLKSSTVKAYRDAVKLIPSVPKSTTHEGHIMISYQRANRDMLKKIKEHLIEEDYKVWMDVDQMGGSTLQAMAEGIENAAVVLLCYSRRYKESDNCRLEAEYAHEQKKPIIPLKMEENYKPDGWLGIMIGSKYFVEFSGKYSFDEKLKDLYRELTRVLKQKPGEAKLVATPTKSQASKPVVEQPRDEVDAAPKDRRTSSKTDVISKLALVRHWKQDDVRNWLTKYSLNTENLDELTGEEISFLARTLHEAPEQLHRYLRKDLKIKSLLAKSRFVWALQEIIDAKNL